MIFPVLIQILQDSFQLYYNQSTMKKIGLTALLLSGCLADQCTLQDAKKTDCGYMGINQQQCEGKGCCWKPANGEISMQQGGTPWCFFPAGQSPCQDFNLNGKDGPGFDDSFYDKMNAFFEANINIQGKGGIVAAPDHKTPGGDYYYHWMRDAALTMRTYMEINDMKYDKIKDKTKAYVGWVRKVQSQTDPNGFDIRINPKFQLPNGEVYVGGWCRPQTDGPGLRSGTLIMFGKLLLENGQTSYFNENVLPAIKFDLDWVFKNWSSDGCDLWQQVRSNDFFWNRLGYTYSLQICQQIADKIGDSNLKSQCQSARQSIMATLDAHWTGTFMKESANRQKDTSVIHAFSSFPGIYSLTDQKVAKTIETLAYTFCGEYSINQQDNKNGVPGMLYGRYPGDSYAGGNPWQLLTAVVGKIFYQGASSMMQSNGFKEKADEEAWGKLLKVKKNSSVEQYVKASLSAGDAIMARLYKYVKNDGGHIAEQIGRNSGSQTSANDLTWSYANILSAMKQRKKASAMLEEFMTKEIVE